METVGEVQCVLCVAEGHQAIEDSVLKMERKGFAARFLALPWISYWARSPVNIEASQGLPGLPGITYMKKYWKNISKSLRLRNCTKVALKVGCLAKIIVQKLFSPMNTDHFPIGRES